MTRSGHRGCEIRQPTCLGKVVYMYLHYIYLHMYVPPPIRCLLALRIPTQIHLDWLVMEIFMHNAAIDRFTR